MKDIKISDILAMLDEGKKRTEIAEELGITMAECRKIFQHPALKGKKAKKPLSIHLIDDVTLNVTQEPFQEATVEQDTVQEEPQGNTESPVTEEIPNWENV